MGVLSIDQMPQSELRGKTVLVRIDLGSQPADDTWPGDSLFTLTHLADRRARVIIATHLEPHDRKQVEPVGLDDVAERLSLLLGRAIARISGWDVEELLHATSHLSDSELLMLEDLSAHPGEEANDAGFAELLARICDIYCNDAFALAHELRASTVGVARRAKLAVAGAAFERELNMLSNALDDPRRPLLVILGGELSKDKLLLAEEIAKRSNSLYVAGQLSFPFLIARGFVPGSAVIDGEMVEVAGRMITQARDDKRDITTPVDFTVADKITFEQLIGGERFVFPPPLQNVPANEIKRDQIICDIGTVTRWGWGDGLGPAGTIFWHGPLGITEVGLFAEGTRSVAAELANRTRLGPRRSVICGRSLVASVRQTGISFRLAVHITEAGRAALHYFAGRPLPAVEVLRQASRTGREPLRILVPVNGSGGDETALHVTAEMAPRDTEILLLHARPGPDQGQYPDVTQAVDEAESFEQRIESERVFARANAILASRGLTSADQVTAQGEPSELILRYAEQMGAELIVVCADGENETAESRRVIDHATCAVLAAGPRVDASPAKV